MSKNKTRLFEHIVLSVDDTKNINNNKLDQLWRNLEQNPH